MNGLRKLREIRAAIRNPLSEASSLLWLRGAEEAVSNRNFSAAHQRLIHAAIAVNSDGLKRETRVGFSELILQTALRTGDAELCSEALHCEAASWILQQDRDEIEASLSMVLKHLDFESQFLQIANGFVHAYPRYAWPRLVRGHAREFLSELRSAIDDFLQAAELFGEGGLEREVSRSHLRASVLLFCKKENARASRISRAIDREHLSYEEKMWLARGWSRSTKWLDHIRGLDVIEELFDAKQTGRLTEKSFSKTQFASTCRDFFSQLPLKLHDGALERFEEIARQLPEECGATSAYDLRQSVSWETPIKNTAGSRLEVETFYRAQKFDLEATVEAVEKLGISVDEQNVREFPIASMVPDLVELHDAADSEILYSAIESMLNHFCVAGRTPSYGWWNLATFLAQNKFGAASVLACRRAISEGERCHPDRESAALARALDWAVRHGTQSELRFWLTAAKPLTAP